MSILRKPDGCRLCPCAGKPGFIPDPTLTREPVGLVMMASPFQEDTYKAKALGGAMGWVVETKWGIHRADFAWTYLLRCWQGGGKPLVGKARGEAVKRCREYDTVVKEFKPTAFLVTFDFRDALEVPPFQRLIQRDFERLRWLREQGTRPMMLMGKDVVHEFAPWLLGKGGIKAIRGHWWEEEL